MTERTRTWIPWHTLSARGGTHSDVSDGSRAAARLTPQAPHGPPFVAALLVGVVVVVFLLARGSALAT
ncbi:MAG TPA: hypothetical protein VFU34_03935, partial [Gaiellaceae bacterium]|nr:hypothetical protein [Gaiellaceae bacterium]